LSSVREPQIETVFLPTVSQLQIVFSSCVQSDMPFAGSPPVERLWANASFEAKWSGGAVLSTGPSLCCAAAEQQIAGGRQKIKKDRRIIFIVITRPKALLLTKSLFKS
jgi:hypothetical protein